MGVDIYGKNKTYFRSNWWYWRPLVDQMLIANPDLYSKVKYWGSNDGDGFDNAKDCIAMANALDTRSMELYVTERQKELASLPNVECEYCHGTGTRTDLHDEFTECNVCSGTGEVRPKECSYPYDWEHTREWISFLRRCHGFEIW